MRKGKPRSPVVFVLAAIVVTLMGARPAVDAYDSDLNNLGPYPDAPGRAVNASDNAPLCITEIMYHPSSENDLEEYIELLNRSGAAVNLSGWEFTDGIDFVFPDMTIGPGEYVVVAADEVVFHAKYPVVTNVTGNWTGRLSNKGETIELVDGSGQLVERFTYSDQGDWAYRTRGPLDHGHVGWIWSDEHDGGGRSLEVINPAMPRIYGANWTASLVDQGTPGEVNSVAASDIAPIIAGVIHFPFIPRPSDPVTVTAQVIDELETGVTVTLFYRVDGVATFSNIAMLDDGLSGDGEADDGIYGTTVPAQADLRRVEFYVQATDAGGGIRTWPTPTQPDGGQLTNALYQVNDTFDPVLRSMPESPPIYFLIMTETERAELADIGNGPENWETENEHESDAQMNGTFISVDGTEVSVRYNVGIRNRGQGSRGVPPNNYRVNFPHDRPWQNVTSININSKYPHSQLAGSAIFAMAGLEAADATAVHVRVNGIDLAVSGSPMFGSYVAVEPLDGEFVDKHFPDDNAGNLYRCRFSANLVFEGTDPNTYRDRYTKQTNEELDDWSDLIQLVFVLTNASDQTFVEEVSQVVNIDQWLRYIALDSLLGNLEGGLATGRGDDYALYRGEDDTRFILIPHDLDTLFGQARQPEPNRDIFTYAAVPGLRRFLTHPEIVPRYYSQFLDLIDTVYSPAALDPMLDELLGGFVTNSIINEMKQFAVERSAGVVAQFSQTLTVKTDLPLVGEHYWSKTPVAALYGTANPLETRSILVNGRPARWSPLDATWRTSDVVVSSGSVWRYLDDGSNQDTEWRELDFDDSLWPSGPAQLGYGDDDERTVVRFGSDPSRKHITTYLRHSFDVSDPSGIVGLTLRLLRDDGAVVYLNGHEILRDNMPGYPGQDDIDSQTTAVTLVGSPEESRFFSFTVDPTLLVTDSNVLAVEIHQAEATSSDLSFDLELIALGNVPLDSGLNHVVVQTFDGADGVGTELDRDVIEVLYDPTNAGVNQWMNVVVRDGYLPGIPVLVRVEILDERGEVNRDLWDAVVTLSTDRTDVTLSTDQIVLYNGLGSALVTVTGSGNFTLTATLDEMEVSRSLVNLEGIPMQTVSGRLPGGGTEWSGIVHVTGNILVPRGHTLTVQPGTLLLINGMSAGTYGANIDVQGTLKSLGTASQPVTFTAYNSAVPWGELHHDSATPAVYQYTNITRAGNSPGSGHTSSGPAIQSVNSTITFERSCITDIAGKIMRSQDSDLIFSGCHLARAVMGPEIEATALLLEDSLISEMFGMDDNDGIYIHRQQLGQTVLLRDCVVADGDDDGVDTLASTVLIENCIMRDFFDKGISVNVGNVTINAVLIVDNDGAGISVKNTARVTVDHTTIVGNGIGIRSHNKDDQPDALNEYFVTNSIIWNNDVTIQTDYDPADIHIDYSNLVETWPGTGNSTMDPMFVDPANNDYHLQPNSPSIDAGDPDFAPDADGTRTDQGFYPFTESETSADSSDVDGNGVVDAIDVQLTINAAIGISTQYNCDINSDGAVDAVDVQLSINSVLGLR